MLTAALMRVAGAAVTVKTYWAWETTATLRLLGDTQGAGAPTEGGAGRGHSLLLLLLLLLLLPSSDIKLLF